MNHRLARQLRKNMTDAERRLWAELRFRQLEGCKFRRQAPLGNYIVDFVTFERKVVIELDGSQHLEQAAADRVRTEWLQSQGFQVLRFWNHEIFEDLDSVMEAIWQAMRVPPHPGPPPQGGREQETVGGEPSR